MKKTITTILFLGVTALHALATETTFAIVDLNAVFIGYSKTKSAETEMIRLKSQAKNELEQFEKNGDAAAVSEFRKTTEAKLQKDFVALRDPILKDIVAAVSAVQVEQKIDFVFDSNAKSISGVPTMFALSGTARDITSLVSSKLNSDANRKKATVVDGDVAEGKKQKDATKHKDSAPQAESSVRIEGVRWLESALGTKVLRITTKAKPGVPIEEREWTLNVILYEKDETGEVQIADVKNCHAAWITEPVDWKDNEPELMDVTYTIPDITRSVGKSRRQFVGYVVGIYHNGKLQDMQAEPGAFAEKFPLPSSFKQDSH
jgi:hypothetical protein